MSGMPASWDWPTTAGTMGAALGTTAYLTLVVTGRRRARCIRGRGARLTKSCESRRRRGWPDLRVASRGPARPWATFLVVWAVGWVLVGGIVGCGTGLLAAYGVRRWWSSDKGRAPADQVAEAALIARQLPITADLLASCLSAGAGPREAAEAVGETVAGPVGDRLARTAAVILLGGEPDEAWNQFGELPGAAPLARCLARASSTGAPAADPVSRLADEIRAERVSAAVARAQRAGVLITAPVGLCFLPAFLAVGVAPVVIGLATGLSRSG
ncbi:type II secretion system F family protein [Streptomyces sp. NPDC056749]|uniref:type II secretion system F family protein n=1 Tax=Streptomyces sp. NPDC056749 TaxID=3345936 RepID=UPI0036811619